VRKRLFFFDSLQSIACTLVQANCRLHILTHVLDTNIVFEERRNRNTQKQFTDYT
jgi:hypothetical protein